MSTPAATAARTARLAEWKNVPSPTFWNMWDRSVNGARPIQVAPSPPIWCTIWARSSIHRAMAWQPTPAPTNEPSGTTVERLWGQPLHQYGVRATSAAPAAAAASMRARRASIATGRAPTSPPSTPERSRSATTAAIRSAPSSPSAGTSRRPRSSVLPTTRGAAARP